MGDGLSQPSNPTPEAALRGLEAEESLLVAEYSEERETQGKEKQVQEGREVWGYGAWEMDRLTPCGRFRWQESLCMPPMGVSKSPPAASRGAGMDLTNRAHWKFPGPDLGQLPLPASWNTHS